MSGGVALAVLAYGGSLFALPLGVKDRIIASLVHAGIATDPQAAVGALAVLAHAETGVTPTTSPAWLIVAAPHSGSMADVLGCLSVCLTFTVVLFAAAALWQRFVGRGPFEVALHSCRVRAAHMFVSR